jgi:hypothetical protein
MPPNPAKSTEVSGTLLAALVNIDRVRYFAWIACQTLTGGLEYLPIRIGIPPFLVVFPVRLGLSPEIRSTRWRFPRYLGENPRFFPMFQPKDPSWAVEIAFVAVCWAFFATTWAFVLKFCP